MTGRLARLGLLGRMYVLALTVTAGALIPLGVVMTCRERDRIAEDQRAHQQEQTRLLAAQINAGYHEQAWPFELLQAAERDPAFQGWAVLDGDGRPVLGSRTPPAGDGLEVVDAPLKIRTGDKDWRFRLAYHRHLIDQRTREVAAITVAAMLAIALALLPLAWWLSRHLLQPLRRLTEAVERFGRDDQPPRAGATTPADRHEIDLLESAFSSMSGRIGVLVADLRGRAVEVEQARADLAAANADLERRVAERTQELAKAQRTLVDLAHAAGRAEVVSANLHTIGNLLTPVVTARDQLKGRAQGRNLQALEEVTRLLVAEGGMAGQEAGRPSSAALLPLLARLAQALRQERTADLDDLERMHGALTMITQVLQGQGGTTPPSRLVTACDLVDLLGLVLDDHAVELQRLGILVDQDLVPVTVRVQAHLLRSLLGHLVVNACEAMTGTAGRTLTIRLRQVEDWAEILLADTGRGWDPAITPGIFRLGHSTKGAGHGFNLHLCAVEIHAWGGSISAASPGPGLGALFTIRLPLAG